MADDFSAAVSVGDEMRGSSLASFWRRDDRAERERETGSRALVFFAAVYYVHC